MAPLFQEFTLPELLAQFPYPRGLSEYYPEAKAESEAWVYSAVSFDEKTLKRFQISDCVLFGALCYSNRDEGLVKVGCDFASFGFVVDEFADLTDYDGIIKMRDIIMDTFRNPNKKRPEGESYSAIGVLARELITKLSNYVSPDAHCVQHFIDGFGIFINGVVKEIKDRDNHQYRTFQDYMTLRPDTAAALVTFSICEFGLDLPEDVYNDPQMHRLREIAGKVAGISNDIYSYAIEKSRGLEIHNSVELVMLEQSLDIQGAIDWLAHFVAENLAAFLDTIANMPSWGEEVDRKVKRYIEGIAQVVRGNDDYSFESGRYFKRAGLEIQRTRVVTEAFLMTKA